MFLLINKKMCPIKMQSFWVDLILIRPIKKYLNIDMNCVNLEKVKKQETQENYLNFYLLFFCLKNRIIGSYKKQRWVLLIDILKILTTSGSNVH